MIKISIALCTYNGEKYLAEQLQSLFDQSLSPDEIVVSDDGSKDSTLVIVETFKLRDRIPIRVLTHDQNLGVYRNFIHCIENCTGDIIFTCDQDDYWMPNKLEKHMLIHTNNPEVDLVYSNAEVVLNTLDHVLYPLWERESILDVQKGKSSFSSLVVKGQSIAGCCMSFKKSFFEKILPVPDLVYHDDWIATSACLSGKIIGLPEPLIKYRQHGGNVVGTVRGSKLSFYKSLFTNVTFYHEADTYIAQRHHRVYDNMANHRYLAQFIQNQNIKAVTELYDARSNYRSRTVIDVVNTLTQQLKKGHYRALNGVWTYLKDLYNLIFIKLSKNKAK
mgnify:CR=1 FL=1